MMIDYAALKAADAALPGKPTADQAAEMLNAQTVVGHKPIPAREVKKLWGRWGVLGIAWVKAQNTALPEEIRAVCRATYDNLMGDLFADMDPTDPAALADITRYLDALESAGVLTEEQRAATLALGVTTRPAREAWGFDGPISYTDVEVARAL